MNPNVTEDRLKSDLDHIHNLIVIDVRFVDKDVLISLNSVHNALFARTCMMSRATYKGSKIEFYPDECAQPLPDIHFPVRKEASKASAKKVDMTVNRFQMLNVDGTEDASDDDDTSTEEKNDSVLPSFSSPAKSTNWARTAVAV